MSILCFQFHLFGVRSALCRESEERRKANESLNFKAYEKIIIKDWVKDKIKFRSFNDSFGVWSR